MSLIRSSSSGRATRLTTMLISAMVIGALTLALPAEAKSKPKKPKKLSKTEKYEFQWMEKTIDHQNRRMLLVQSADPSTTHTELKAFDQEFLAQEQQEMATLQGWLATWYGITYVPKTWNGDDDDEDCLSEEDDPNAFDLELIDCLIGYLSQERAQCKQIVRKAGHQELKDYGKQVILLNDSEKKILKSWQRAWEPAEAEDED